MYVFFAVSSYGVQEDGWSELREMREKVYAFLDNKDGDLVTLFQDVLRLQDAAH